MERKASLSPLFRNKNAPKAPYGGVSRVGNQLVRMRSPVQIWIAAPQSPLFSAENGGFFLLSALFFAVEFLQFGFDHITRHRQKNSPSGCPRWAMDLCQPAFGSAFSRSFSAAISVFISAISFANSFSHSSSL